MIFGALQVGLGLALLAAPLALGPVGAALVWPGVAVLVVGLAYLAKAPGVFGKRTDDGRMSTFALALLFPYVALAWTLWQLKSRLHDEAPWHEVAPGLLLGRRPRSAAELPPGTACIVDLTSELPRALPEASARYLCLPTLDTDAPTDEGLAALITTLSGDEGPLFVHCAMGHGRSAAVATALLVARGLARDVDDAVAKLKAVRPGVHLHRGQRAAVMRWAEATATLRSDDPPKDRPDRASHPA